MDATPRTLAGWLLTIASHALTIYGAACLADAILGVLR